MSLLPRKGRKKAGTKTTCYAYGGELPEDPALLKRRQQQATQGQLTSAASSAAAMIPGVGTAISAGLQVGQQVGNMVTAGSKDENGLYKKDNFGTNAAAALENAINPVKSISRLAGLVTGKTKLNDFYGIKADVKLRQQMQERQQRELLSQSDQQSRAAYGGLSVPGFGRGGLLPAARKFAGGGAAPKMPPKRAPGYLDQAGRYLDRGLEQVAGATQRALVGGLRKTLPINVAMAVQDVSNGLVSAYAPNSAFNRTARIPLTEKDLTPEEMKIMRSAAAGRNDKNEILYPSYGVDNPDGGGIMSKFTNPKERMATTVGGAMVSPNGRTVTDSFDFGGTDAKNHAEVKKRFGSLPATMQGVYQQAGVGAAIYEGVRYLEGEYGSTVDGKGIPVKLNLGKPVKRKATGWDTGPVALDPKEAPWSTQADEAAWNAAAKGLKRGGLLPGGKSAKPAPQRSVIASGALHSQKNQLDGKRGIPVLHAATGAKLAEVERDEWTLADEATQQLERFRGKNDLVALGKLVQQELLTNTTPSKRYEKRLSR